MEFDWNARIPKRLADGKPYIPGEQKNTSGWTKLNTNEFPYEPTPAIYDSISGEVKRLRLYPDPTGKELRSSLAAHHGVPVDQVVLFNGCDDALNCCVRGFLEPGDQVGVLNPSYSLYKNLLANHGCQLRPVEYGAEFDFPKQDLLDFAGRMLMLTSPNAPSGKALPKTDLCDVIRSRKSIVVLDETYADFADWTAIDSIDEHPNLVVTRSFSKTYGLAGLRVGYVIAHPDAVRVLDLIRDVYNVDRLGQVAAQAAVEDVDYYRSKHKELLETRDRFSGWLADDLKWEVIESSTNFVFCYPQNGSGERGPSIAEELFAFLIENHILVRYFPNHPLTSGGLRISIGRPEDMLLVQNTIQKWLQKEQLQ